MKYIDCRSYPKMKLAIDAPLPYLIGVHEAMHFILSVDPQAVPLSAAEARDRVAELIEAKLHDMEENV